MQPPPSQVDSSGLKLTYTSTLRNNSMGVLTLGNTDLRIPAAADFYTALPNICPASCTSKRVVAPVTLVSNFYMMNGLGVSALTRHIRNGSAIQPVGRINYWDYGYNVRLGGGRGEKIGRGGKGKGGPEGEEGSAPCRVGAVLGRVCGWRVHPRLCPTGAGGEP